MHVIPVPDAAHCSSVHNHQRDASPLVYREVSDSSSDDDSVTPSSGSESDDDGSDSDSESWGKVYAFY